MCSGWQNEQERESSNVTLSSCALRNHLCTFGMRDNEVVPFFFGNIPIYFNPYCDILFYFIHLSLDYSSGNFL